jgi:hypothetical protein
MDNDTAKNFKLINKIQRKKGNKSLSGKKFQYVLSNPCREK